MDQRELRDIVPVLRRVLRKSREKDVKFFAASLAYYAFVSLLPGLLLVMVLASVLGGETIAESVVSAVQGLLTPEAQESLTKAISRGSQARGGVTVIGILLLLWGTLKVFRCLDVAFSRIYGVSGTQSLVEGVKDAVVVLTAIGLGVGAMVVFGWVVTLFYTPLIGFLGTISLFVALVVVLFPLYYLLPDTPMLVTEALPGTVLAAVSWTVLDALFQVYASYVGADVYGVLGGLLLFITWIYIGAFTILISAVVNAVLSEGEELP
ncbi:MAG: YihY/virulence factor BrkB family protein [Halobacteria archaeon]|nr:YihY/virulence factor BrkB family protein [Halobacteria archaeon]